MRHCFLGWGVQERVTQARDALVSIADRCLELLRADAATSQRLASGSEQADEQVRCNVLCSVKISFIRIATSRTLASSGRGAACKQPWPWEWPLDCSSSVSSLRLANATSDVGLHHLEVELATC